MPRFQAAIRAERAGERERDRADTVTGGNPSTDIQQKGSMIYHHALIRFNYTTYDVRRASDVVIPGKTNCNVMLLASTHAGQPVY